MTEEAIVALADLHFKQTGPWPQCESGPVRSSAVPGETWARLNDALIVGCHGLPGGSSMAKLLMTHRGV
jgi:hypothetical protein